MLVAQCLVHQLFIFEVSFGDGGGIFYCTVYSTFNIPSPALFNNPTPNIIHIPVNSQFPINIHIPTNYSCSYK